MKRGKRGIACLLAAALALGGMLPLPSAAAELAEAAETQPVETVPETSIVPSETEAAETIPEGPVVPEETQADETVPESSTEPGETQADETVPEAPTEPEETQTDETVPEDPTEPEETQETSSTEPTESETQPEEEPMPVEEGWMTVEYIPEDILPDNAELTEGYAQRLFYGDSGISFYGEAARGQLQTPGAVGLYDGLKEGIQQIAAGQRSSAVFQFSEEDFRRWGVDPFIPISAEDPQMAFLERLEWQAVSDALLHDCPFDLYWFDKTSGTSWGTRLGWAPDGDGYIFLELTVMFRVVADHRPSGYDPSAPTVDTRFAQSAIQASNYAKSIVAASASLPDYDRLFIYRDEICSLVNYNYPAAASGNYSADADPWQLIYVFDQDPSTNVVCEGYAKAFQYLCDESQFSGNTRCYTVTGDMDGGGHMWNIVHIGGKNYLTDITCCDGGFPLLLAGASGSVSGGYRAEGIYYAYDSDTLGLWSEQELTLSDTRYTPGQVFYKPGDLNGDETVNEDDAIYLLLYLALPELYELHADGNIDSKNGTDEDDAIYLLLYLSLPEAFPLYP